MSDIYLNITETPAVVTLSQAVISGAVAGTVTVSNTVTVALDANSLSALENVTVTVGSAVSVSGTVTVGNSVTIGSIPAISGTVTANVPLLPIPQTGAEANSYNIQAAGVDINGYAWPIPITIDGLNVPISGTVTANFGALSGINDKCVQLYVWDDETNEPRSLANYGENPFIRVGITGDNGVSISNSVTIGSLPVQLSTTTIGGTARLNVTLSSATTVGATAPSYANLYGGSDGANLRAISVDSSGRTVVTGTTSILGTSAVTFGAVTGSISILGTPSVTMGAISGTVTASVASTTVTVSALPSGALTTRFGSVTTANTAQLTAAVTNSARKYLLAQNLDSSTTVTIGIGFTPTTTQGIQLAAGGGIIMDSFVSTGAVWWLSSTTGSNFTILEG